MTFVPTVLCYFRVSSKTSCSIPNIFCQKNFRVFQDGKKSLLSLQNLSLCSTWQSLIFFLFGLSSFHLKEFFLRVFFHLYSPLYFSFHFSCSRFFVLKKTHFSFLFFGFFFFFFLFILKFQLKWTTSISIISLHAPFYDSVEPNFAFTVQKFCILLFTTSLVFPIFLSFFF